LKIFVKKARHGGNRRLLAGPPVRVLPERSLIIR